MFGFLGAKKDEVSGPATPSISQRFASAVASGKRFATVEFEWGQETASDFIEEVLRLANEDERIEQVQFVHLEGDETVNEKDAQDIAILTLRRTSSP